MDYVDIYALKNLSFDLSKVFSDFCIIFFVILKTKFIRTHQLHDYNMSIIFLNANVTGEKKTVSFLPIHYVLLIKNYIRINPNLFHLIYYID